MDKNTIDPAKSIPSFYVGQSIFLTGLFDKLREKQSSNFKKLIPVFGEISQENFNLSVVDRQMLIERVTIIIHNAASVKFNDSLKYAILTNTRSTRDICILAENVKNLIALVYVDTAYTHLDNAFIEEKFIKENTFSSINALSKCVSIYS